MKDSFDIIPEENGLSVNNMLQEYAKSAFGKSKSGLVTPSRNGSNFKSSFKRHNKMGQLGFGLASKLASKVNSKKSSGGNQRKDTSTYQKSIVGSPLLSPKDFVNQNKKKSKFAPDAVVFEDSSPMAKNAKYRVSLTNLRDQNNSKES